ncbi:histamine H1 receptor [Oncorhynchus tshawytscha]|uniref:G-protein coupled receptors family 1 profile domain-containing protein n=1 Tax=Oncorhynchus tshawytscha TaxID=74940 RepID=A0A8C8GJG5_ONCTS|nr:histamine H1 receptor [Oncorhynchus tshawytscha]
MMDSIQSTPDVFTPDSISREPYHETQQSPSNSTIPAEHHYSFHNTLLGVFLGFLSLLTVVMNILVLYAVKKERTLHTVGNLYIVSLSVADLIVGATVMPLNLVYLLEDEWRLGRVVCQFWLIMDYVASTASIFSLFILCLDRYRSVHEPLRYLKYRTRRRASVMISGAWLLSTMWIIPILGWRSFATVDLKPEMENKCDTDFRFVTWFKVLTSVFNFHLPSLLMLWFYSRIYMAVRRHFRERERIINPTDSTVGNRIGHKVQTGNRPCESSNEENKGNDCDFDQYTLDQLYNSTDTAETNASREPKSEKDCHSSHSLLRMTKRLRKTVKGKRKSRSLSFREKNSDSETPLNLSTLPLHFTHTDDNNAQGLYVSVSDTAAPLNSVAGVCEITQIADVQRYTTMLYNDFTQSLNSPPSPWPHNSPPSPWPQEDSEPDDGANPDAVANAVTLKQTWQKFCAQSRQRIQSLQVHKEHKAAKQLGCIIAGFMTCWIPYFIVFMVMAFCQTCVHHDLHMFTIWLGYINSTLNPFIYPLCNENFKRVFKKILHIHL